MKKLLFSLSFILAVLLIVYLAFFGKKTETLLQQNNFLPTPTPVSILYPTNKSGLLLKSTDPKDGSTNVLTNKKVVLTFNRTFNKNDITFSITPSVPFDTSVSGNTYTITFHQPLATDTTYIYFIAIKEVPSYTYSFLTVHDPSVTTPPDNAAEIQNEINKHNYPDQYLTQYTPHNTDNILITSSYSEDLSVFTFEVTYYSSLDEAKREFMSWGESLGLTQPQVQSLMVNYQQSSPAFE